VTVTSITTTGTPEGWVMDPLLYLAVTSRTDLVPTCAKVPLVALMLCCPFSVCCFRWRCKTWSHAPSKEHT
jgi:hypothetical protein